MQNSCRRTQSARRRSLTRVTLAIFATGCVFACCLFPAVRLLAAPPTLLNGVPKVPDVGNIDADLIRVSAEVDDTDDLAIYPDKLQWRHRRGASPAKIRVNGVEWNSKAKPVLPVSEKPGIFPTDFVWLGAALDPLRLRGKITFQATPQYLLINLYDGDSGPDRIEFAIRPGEHLTPVKADPRTSARIAELFAANPRQPHPNAKEARTRKDLKAIEARWRHKRLAGAFEEYGSRGAPWEKEAIDFLELAARDPAVPPAELIAAGDAVLNLGCDDPLVCAVLGETLWKANQPAKAEPLLMHAVLAFENGKYPARVTRRAPGVLARIIRGESDEKRKLGEGLMARCIAETVQMLEEKLADGEERAILGELKIDVGDDPFSLLRGNFARTLRAIGDSADCNPWIAHVLQGEYLIDQGWQARGAGRADTVTGEGWQDFGQLVDQARIHLAEAWTLHPEFPEAAVRLITTTMAIGGLAEESTRFWFDQAVAAQIDVRGAHSNYLQALLPRWEGSHEELMEFGLELLRIDRFDTPVPLYFYNAAWDILKEQGNARALLRQLNGEQDVAKAFEAFTKETTEYLPLATIQTENAALASALGMPDVAKIYLDQVGDNLDLAALSVRGVDPAVLRSDLSSPGLSADKAPERLPIGTLLQNPAPIYATAISDDGSKIAISSLDKEHFLTLWDLAKGTHEALPVDNQMSPYNLTFSPNGKHLAGIQNPLVNRTIRTRLPWATITLWDLETKTQREILPHESYQVNGLAWLPDGRNVVSGAGMLETLAPFGARILNTKSGNTYGAVWSDTLVTSIAVSPDGKVLAMGLKGGSIRLVPLPEPDALKDEAPKPIPLEADLGTLDKHVKPVNALSFSPDGKWLASSGREDHSVWVWDVKEKRAMHRLEGSLLAFSPDSKRLATAEGQKLLQQGAVWDVETGRPLLRLVNADGAANRSVAFTADGAFVVMAGVDTAIRTWEIEIKE